MNKLGEWVWVAPSNPGEFDVAFAAKIMKLDRNRILILDDDGAETWVNPKDIVKTVHATSSHHVDDMISLGDLQEESILRNLKLRYREKKIYTYTSTMLVAINPYEKLNIYSKSHLDIYRNKRLGEVPPHIFAIGDCALQRIKEYGRDQCIVISGESGAGKTESTKLLLQYLASVSGKKSWIEQQIIESNPIMEAFGNAKTIRNENSSRFGKYIDIKFNREGTITGAKIEQYLLEKSRIVSQNSNERNYHIFYSMLEGLSTEEKEKLELTSANDFKYLKQGDNSITCEGRNEVKVFEAVRHAMKILSFTEAEMWDIFQLLAALLHLGNLNYTETDIQNMEAVELNDSVNLFRVSTFLGIPQAKLKTALMHKSIVARGERVVSLISKEQAIEVRDAFAKAVYGKIFLWIIEKINTTISTGQVPDKESMGVLDIFGFENFENNSFEQLCINYANENLQQFFVTHIFQMEQEEYEKENIGWKHITYTDNREILEMIGVKSVNIFSLIDEEAKFPKGTDATLLTKLHLTHGDKTIYRKPKYESTKSFGIQHFAGTVYYKVAGFLEKNRDSVSLDLRILATNSSNKFLRKLFETDDVWENGKKPVTLLAQFKNSLELLIKTLSMCEPFFIRCIKPNEVKKARIFDSALVVRQLRYSGMMETAKIRKSGYSVRYTFKDFVDRFQVLIKNFQELQRVRNSTRNPPNYYQNICKEVCKRYLPSDENFYQLGLTKVFLKNDTLLEREREKVYVAKIVMIQRWYRRIVRYRQQQRRIWAATVVQKHWRARGYRTRFLIMRQGLLRLQAVLRSRQLAAAYEKRKRVVTGLQAHCRGFLTRRKLHNKIDNKTKRLIELTIIRRQEELQFRRAGHKRWRELAEEKYHERVTKLMQAEKKRRLEDRKAIEEAKRLQEKQRIEEEAKRVELERRRQEEARKLEEARRLEEIRRIEETRRIEEAKRLEESRRSEERKRLDLRKADDDRKRAQERRLSNDRRQNDKNHRQQTNSGDYTNGYRGSYDSHPSKDREQVQNSRLEEEIKFIDDEFGFLQETSIQKPVPPPRVTSVPVSSERKEKKSTITVKKMKSFFEEQSKNMKQIPTKLLSRPTVTYSSRL